jgi:hypothetical protein
MADYEGYWKPWWEYLTEDERKQLVECSRQMEFWLLAVEAMRWDVRQLRQRAYSRQHRRTRPKALDHSLESS